MKHPRSRIIVPICIAILMVSIMPAPAGAVPRSITSDGDNVENSTGGYENRPASIATPSPTATSGDGSEDPSAESKPGEATGEIIRRRVLGMTVAGAAIAAVSLLLLWVYNMLRDPLRRHRASTRIRQLRREERRERARRRRTE
jgi:hypothetical protein